MKGFSKEKRFRKPRLVRYNLSIANIYQSLKKLRSTYERFI